ncbi:ATP-grasp domain-containing protein [Streptomyces sp. BF23-19]|uniref:ATP-grasp domain-containing protein n=1 Tax=unclassified Streptomyces TaxID=2593676 RepID=UPI0034E48EAC
MDTQHERKPRVLVIAGRAGKLKVAADAGYEVVYLQNPQLFADTHRAHVSQALLMDYTRIDEVLPVVAGLHAADRLDLVVSFTDPGLEPAAVIGERLGLPGNPPAVSTVLRDKYALRRLLADAGIEEHPCARVRTAEELKAFCTKHHYPVILKPQDGTGSQGIRRMDSPEDADRAFADRPDSDGALLAETLLTGMEVSVESITQHGHHRVIAITEKFIDENYVELGHVVPARIAPGQRDAIEKLVLSLLDAVGLAEGCAHTEVMLTADGPVIIESHNRMGGDRIYELVRLSHGTDLERLSFTLPLDADTLPPTPTPTRAAAVWFVRAEPGRVLSVDGESEAKAAEGVCEVVVTTGPGSEVNPVRSSADRIGYVIAVGADADEALDRARRAAQSVVVRTEEAA